MGAENILPNAGIKVMLAGEEKTLRFNMKSMAVLAEKYGTVTKVLEIFDSLARGNMTSYELHGLGDLVSAATIKCDKKMTLEYIEDMYDVEELMALVPSIIDAYLLAMGAKNKVDSGDPTKA